MGETVAMGREIVWADCVCSHSRWVHLVEEPSRCTGTACDCPVFDRAPDQPNPYWRVRP